MIVFNLHLHPGSVITQTGNTKGITFRGLADRLANRRIKIRRTILKHSYTLGT